MDRNESWQSLSIAAVAVHLAWGQVRVTGEDVPGMRMTVSGSEGEVTGLRVQLEEGKLLIEQPNLGISSVNVMEQHWLQVSLQIPRDWKGQVEITTTTGRLQAEGLSGTDLRLDTVGGEISCRRLSFMSGEIKTVTGGIDASGVRCGELSVRTVSGGVQLHHMAMDQLRLGSVTADARVHMDEPFVSVALNTITGGVAIEAPVEQVHVQRRAPAGRLQLWEVQEQPDAPQITMNTVSGSL